MPKGNSRYDTEHLRNISAYQRQIDEIFKAADEEAARIVKASGAEYDPDRPFSFDDYPSVKKRVDKMTSDLASRVERTIVNGIKAQWELSNRKNDDLVETVTGLKADDFPADQRRRYFGTNEPARKAFTERAREDMGLSEEVWRFRRETEFGIDLSLKGLQDRMERGLSEGVSAADMSRELRGYLKNPDKLFRRVRDERGNLTLSRNARLFHPGQGVYRSSYMNARRLAATETNMAYRSADHERWKSLDFVVGIEIQTSNNHTTKDSTGKTVELEDICDTLAGRYPKDFKFVGWHPHCRCIATTILKTEEEMEADTERIMDGEEPLSPDTSENYIGNTPDDFNNWAIHNLKRIDAARQNGTLPYFLKDNEQYITIQKLGDALLSTAKGFANVDWSELEKAVRKGYIAEIRKQIDAVSLKVDEAKANGGSNGGGYNGGDVQLDDDEIRRRVHKAFADIGETIDDKDIKIEDGYVCLNKEQMEKLSAGQSITHSEDDTIYHHYIQTAESFSLLETMRFDKNKLYNPIPATTSLETATDRIRPFTPQMIETAKALESVISKNKLDFPVRVIRMIGIEAVENAVGLRGTAATTFSKDIAGAYNKFKSLGNFTMKEGGYMSISFDPDLNEMGNRSVMLVIDLPAGTNIYVTRNIRESEGILGRGMELMSKRLEIGNISYYNKPKDVLKIYCRPK